MSVHSLIEANLARPKTIDDETILEAAREVFQERGFAGTTAEVAARAGISEGSIFRRFRCKQDLFLACMGLPKPKWLIEMNTDPNDAFWEDLEALAHEIFDHMLIVIPKIMLLHGAFLDNEIPEDAVPVVAQKKITLMFENNAEKSEVLERSEEAARIFFGALHTYAFTHVLGIDAKFETDRGRYMETLILMLKGAR